MIRLGCRELVEINTLAYWVRVYIPNLNHLIRLEPLSNVIRLFFFGIDEEAIDY